MKQIIFCIKPVLQFGEMSGSVQVKRMTPLRPDTGLTPGRRKIVDVSINLNISIKFKQLNYCFRSNQ